MPWVSGFDGLYFHGIPKTLTRAQTVAVLSLARFTDTPHPGQMRACLVCGPTRLIGISAERFSHCRDSTASQPFVVPGASPNVEGSAGGVQTALKVDSALVTMSLPGQRSQLSVTGEARSLRFVQICFAHKRKTLRNSRLSLAPGRLGPAGGSKTGLPPDVRGNL